MPVAPEKLAEVYLVVGPLYRRAQRHVESAPDHDVVPVGVRAVLDMLRRDGARTVPQMARSQGLSRQYVQRMVDRALAGGMIERRGNPRHWRSVLLDLTPRGRAAIGAVIDRETDQLAQVARSLDDADVDACLRVLRHMHDALDVDI